MTRALGWLLSLSLVASAYAGDCPGDCNGDGAATILDFVCFQQEWQAQTDKGDCDANGIFNVLDFVCFQTAFQDFQGGGCDAPTCPLDELDDDFESYDLGNLCYQNCWEPWDLVDGVCADIVDTHAASGSKSLEVLPNGDMVQVFDINEGQWTVSIMTFVPLETTGVGYVIMLNTYEHLGAKDWSMQCAFEADLGFVEAQDQGFEIAPLIKGEWVELRAEIDLDADTCDMFYNGDQFVFGGNWSDGAATAIQCLDIYNGSMNPAMYYDDNSVVPNL